LRLALTYPWCWPWVQRGGERLFADLGQWLVGAGHEVTVVTAAPAPRERTVDGSGRRVVRQRALRSARLGIGQRQQAITYLPGAALALRRARPDVVHGLFHLDGVAARLAGRRPYLVHVQGMPSRAVLERQRIHRRLLPMSLRQAAAVLAVSEAAAAGLRDEFGIPAVAVLNGVFVEDFRAAAAGVEKSPEPTILFPGDPADPRKRLPVLEEAVRQLAGEWPGVRLVVASPTPPSEMPAAYARAWVTCLPAVKEAFGLVFIESLAVGTPVVGVRDGGVPEVVHQPDWLAEPDDVDDLAARLHTALLASQAADIADRCRAMAAPFDWSVRGPAFEAIYRDVSS